MLRPRPGGVVMSSATVRHWLAEVSAAALPFESRWTWLTLRRVDDDLGRRLFEQRGLFDQACVTGTAAEVTPIRELNDTVIGRGTRGPVTEAIQRRFFDAVLGREARYHDRLHRVGTPAPLSV